MSPRRRWAVAMLAAAALFAGCSRGDGGDAPAPAPASTGSAAPAGPATTATTVPPVTTSTTAVAGSPSPGCADPEPAVDGRRTMQSGGFERSYLLNLPPASDAPAPLVLSWHGFGSNAVEQVLYTGLGQAGPARGYVVATPEGLGDPARWNVLGDPPTGAPDDLLFASDLLDELGSRLCLDLDRVYSTGMSNGAVVSSRLACVLGGRIAAIAPVAGVIPPVACTGPVPVLAFHGTADTTTPYEGGPVGGDAAVANAGVGFPAVPDSMAAWAALDGCAPAPESEEAAPQVRLLRFDCPSGRDVASYVVEGGGHTWPGAIDVPWLGPVTSQISATALLLDFFDAHPGATGVG